MDEQDKELTTDITDEHGLEKGEGDIPVSCSKDMAGDRNVPPPLITLPFNNTVFQLPAVGKITDFPKYWLSRNRLPVLFPMTIRLSSPRFTKIFS